MSALGRELKAAESLIWGGERKCNLTIRRITSGYELKYLSGPSGLLDLAILAPPPPPFNEWCIWADATVGYVQLCTNGQLHRCAYLAKSTCLGRGRNAHTFFSEFP